jgi:hypothetical protein
LGGFSGSSLATYTTGLKTPNGATGASPGLREPTVAIICMPAAGPPTTPAGTAPGLNLKWSTPRALNQPAHSLISTPSVKLTTPKWSNSKMAAMPFSVSAHLYVAEKPEGPWKSATGLHT